MKQSIFAKHLGLHLEYIEESSKLKNETVAFLNG